MERDYFESSVSIENADVKRAVKTAVGQKYRGNWK